MPQDAPLCRGVRRCGRGGKPLPALSGRARRGTGGAVEVEDSRSIRPAPLPRIRPPRGFGFGVQGGGVWVVGVAPWRAGEDPLPRIRRGRGGAKKFYPPLGGGCGDGGAKNFCITAGGFASEHDSWRIPATCNDGKTRGEGGAMRARVGVGICQRVRWRRKGAENFAIDNHGKRCESGAKMKPGMEPLAE